MSKIKVGIIGSGNIGCDLLVKVMKSNILECTIFLGRNYDSKGLSFARELGVKTSFESIDYIVKNPKCCDIVFDATSSKTHEYHAAILRELGIFTLDLTPARVGGFCIPSVNIEEALSQDNINLVTCGGQATIPLIYAISKVHKNIEYIEVVATVASRSAGSGTRNNIDEFTQTTRDALSHFSGVNRTKAIIILNPAEPPITMRNTIYMLIDNPDLEKIKREVAVMEKRIKKYVPGYRVVLGPIYENGKVTISIEVVGSGDFLPKYSGNLDIITCAAIEIAEEYAIRKLGG